MGHLAPEVAPEQLDGVQPGTVGRQVEQHQSTSRPAQERLYLVVLVGIGVVPGGHLDSSHRMLFQQRLQQFGDLCSALGPTDQDHPLTGMVVAERLPRPGGVM